MDKFEKLKKHIEEKAKKHSDLADNNRVYRDNADSKLVRNLHHRSWIRNLEQARTLFEIIDFMNNMED